MGFIGGFEVMKSRPVSTNRFAALYISTKQY